MSNTIPKFLKITDDLKIMPDDRDSCIDDELGRTVIITSGEFKDELAIEIIKRYNLHKWLLGILEEIEPLVKEYTTEHYGCGSGSLNKIRAAITKAKGEIWG